MDFRRQKLRLAAAIIVTGMLVALIWHGWQGWVLGHGYPDNTFLFRPEVRYTDFTDVLRLASFPGVHNNYFPATYLIFYPFLYLPPVPAAILFLDVCAVVLFFVLNHALSSVVPEPGRRLMTTSVFLWSYPVLYGLDRGNSEILLVILVALSLLAYQQKKFGVSFLYLLPAICFKLYPGILLFLFFRRKLIHWVLIGAAAFVVINGGLLLAYPGSFTDNLANLLQQFTLYNRDYTMGQHGISASASAWNLFRICVWLVYSFIHQSYVWPMPFEMVTAAFRAYYFIFLGVLSMVTVYTLLVETTFPRKAALLLLYLTVSAPGGGDYKVMYVGVALIIFILMTERRTYDLLITGLLALCLVPKREIFLSFVGSSDSGYDDCSLNVIMIPLCILLAMALLMWDGWQSFQPPLDRRLAKLAGILRMRKLYRAIVPPILVPVRTARRKGRR